MFLHKNRDIYVVDIIRVLCIIQKHVNIYIVKYLNNKIRPYNTALIVDGKIILFFLAQAPDHESPKINQISNRPKNDQNTSRYNLSSVIHQKKLRTSGF